METNNRATEPGKTAEPGPERESGPTLLREWIEEGFVCAEVIRGMNGEICDWRYVEINDVALKQTGLRATDFIGRLGSDSPAGLDEWWLRAVRHVMETGQSEQLEQHTPEVNRWY